jgi:glycosyltransferase involved in cell wall biosynthesis
MSREELLRKKNLLIVSQIRISSFKNIPGKSFHEAKTWATIFNKVIFICFFDHDHSGYHEINDNLLVIAIPFSLSKSPIKTLFNLVSNYIRLMALEIKVINKYRIDLIREENLIIVGIPTFLVSKMKKIPFVTWLGGFERNAFNILYEKSVITRIFTQIIKFLEFLICSSTSMAFTVSLDLFRLLKKRNLKNIYLSPNFVDFNIFTEKTEFNNTKSKKVSILYSGRYEKEKGIDNLLNAINLLSRERRNFELHLIGYGTLEDWIRDFIKSKNLENHVFLRGKYPLSKLPEFYKKADIFIIPSYTEGLPAALLEAMCSGCACICTDVGLISSYISNDVNGFIVKPGNSQDLANAIKILIDNPDKLMQFGKRSREVIQTKSGHYVGIHKKIYSYVIQQKRD